MRKSISSVIFIGAIWGIVEATVGHFLHVFTLGIGWMLWFPIAFFFLNSVYRITRKTSCMLYTAVIAAGIKMIDIFYTPRYDYVINPAVSILLEGLAVLCVYTYYFHKTHTVKLDIISIILASTGWKVLYLCYLLFLPESWIDISCLSGLIPFTKFFFLETVMNTLLISFCIIAVPRISFLKIKLTNRLELLFNHRSVLIPFFSLLTLMLAIIVQINL
jgi:hypothetical protein